MRHRCTSQQMVDMIKRPDWEGFSPVPYICPAGLLTIGHGHVIRPEERFGWITEETAEDILRADLFRAERAVLRLIGVPLKDNQFDALVSFTFNLGAGRLQHSTLRMKVNREEHEAAAAEFLKWVYGGGRKLPGLIKRRNAEREMFLG